YAHCHHRALHSFPTRRSSDLGIDLRRVKGSEEGGRIVMADLKAYISRLRAAAAAGRPKAAAGQAGGVAPEKIDFGKWGSILKKPDRKSTRLNSSHVAISYAVF